MTCSRCGYRNPPESSFCLECGTPLVLVCAACGAELPTGSSFCNKCGVSVKAPVAGPARFSSPAAYTPRHLAERILLTKSALEGERKEITVLFADLEGSMELLAERDSDEARDVLDPVLERMMEAVHFYEGTVNQVMGDGIMAVFGAPLALEDHAIRACYAALRMQDSTARHARDMLRVHGITLGLRIGLNSGEVVVRTIRNDLRTDYSAIGRTTHLAARMEQIARPGSVLLAVDTVRMAEGFIEVKSLGPLRVKGLPDPVQVFELTGAASPRTRFAASAARGLTRFAGRQAELESLHRAAVRVRSGHGQVAALVGEPGAGKSRLAWEFGHSRPPGEWLILEAGSLSYGRTTAYLPLIDLVRAYFQIERRDDARKIQERVTGKVSSLDSTLELFLPAFLSLLDVPVEDAQWARLQPSGRRQWILEGIERLLVREGEVQPILLLFEDLQWIDQETQAFLVSLLDRIAAARILLILTYRPEYQPSWGSKAHLQLRIDPLPPSGAMEILLALLGVDAALIPLARRLVERTEGNPFFIEESVRHLAEAGVLEGERGAYRLARPLESVPVPHGVQAILAARIDRLPDEAKPLLQSAAVIGKTVPLMLLQVLAKMPEEVFHRALANLQSAELLHETMLFPDVEYIFTHTLTHEVVYGSLVQERRRSLHARLVAAMEAVYAEHLTDQVERLGYHAVRGEVWEKAVVYLHQAGTRAMARSSFRQAADYIEQALDSLRHVPEERHTIEQEIELRLAAQRALHPLGETERIQRHLSRAETLARTLGDERRLGRVAADMANYFWLVGNPVEAAEAAQRALAIAAAREDFSLTVTAGFYLGQAYHALGDYQKAIEVLGRNLSAWDPSVHHGRFGVLYFGASCAWAAWCLAELGNFAEATQYWDRGLRLAAAFDQPYNLIAPSFGAGIVHLIRGDLVNSGTYLRRSFEMARAAEFLYYLPLIGSALALSRAQSGRVGETVALLDEAACQPITFPAGTHAFLGEASLLVGRVEEARAHAARALSVSREGAHRGLEAYALRLLGDIGYQAAADRDVALSHYQQALTLAQQLGMRPLAAHCHLGLARLYRHAGEQGKATDHLAEATTGYREMDMPSWLEKVGTQAG